MPTQTPYYQFLTSPLYLQLDSPLGRWGCHCSLTHQNKYWLGTFCSLAGGQVLLSATSAKPGLDTTSHHKYFLHFYSCSQVRQCSFFPVGHYSLLPALQILFISTWVGWFLRVNHLPLVWSHCEVFRLGFLQWCCSGQSLQFLQRWGAGGFFVIDIG